MYNGVSPAEFSVPEREPDRPTVVFMGRINPLKDLHTLIRAFPSVRAEVPDAVLRICGGTPEKDILARPANAPKPIQVVPYGQAASAPAAAAAPAASTPQERAAASDKARKAAESEAKIKAQEQRDAQAKAENCRAARQQLAALESGVRVATVNERGERTVLDDSQRAQEIRKAQAVIAADCK